MCTDHNEQACQYRVSYTKQSKETQQNPKQQRAIRKEAGFLVCLRNFLGAEVAWAAGTGLLALQQTQALPTSAEGKERGQAARSGHRGI